MNTTPKTNWLSPQFNGGIVFTLLVSGAIGFVLGCFVMPTWQVAVETAQVVAGLVDYPKDNPFYMYHVKLWTLLHQVLAPLLKAGVPEKNASLLVSGLLGMVTLQAFATIILALSRDCVLAIGGAVVIFFARPNEVGVSYPVWFMGSEHTYGVLGLSYTLLVLGLIGGGWLKSGAFLLGLAPAVHPSLGFWLGVIIAGCCLLDMRRFRENWLPCLRPFLIGGAVTTVSLIIQMTVVYDVAKTGVAIDGAKYFNAFVSFWDMHRAPVDAKHPGVIFNWCVLVLATVWLVFFRKDCPQNSSQLVRALVVSSALGLGAMALSWVAPDKLPRTLVMLMPTRLLNVAIIASLPVLLGLVGIYRKTVPGQILMSALLVGLLLGGATDDGMLAFYSSNIWMLLVNKGGNPETLAKLMINPWKWMIGISIAAMVVSIVLRKKSAEPEKIEKARKSTGKKETPVPFQMAPWLQRFNWLLLAVFAVLTVMLALQMGPLRREQFRIAATTPVLAEVAKGKGMLLTGGDLHLIQLRTRRPVLLDGGGLDGVAYIVPAAPMMDQILKEVYQIDMFHPPEEARGIGSVPSVVNQVTWQELQPDQWKAIGAKYHVAEVLTPAGWQLNLQAVISDDQYIVYRIPEP